MECIFHTTTCALVGKTIPAANDGLLPPACLGFAQNLPKQHGIIYLLFIFQILKIKND
jgi:hypothetical protein